jgi:hypothetical protein
MSPPVAPGCCLRLVIGEAPIPKSGCSLSLINTAAQSGNNPSRAKTFTSSVAAFGAFGRRLASLTRLIARFRSNDQTENKKAARDRMKPDCQIRLEPNLPIGSEGEILGRRTGSEESG